MYEMGGKSARDNELDEAERRELDEPSFVIVTSPPLFSLSLIELLLSSSMTEIDR